MVGHMSLGLKTTGRAVKVPMVLAVRELTLEEVVAHGEVEQGISSQPLRRITSRHRQLARLLAAGTKIGEAAVEVGLTASHASVLLSNQIFKDLVRHYEIEIESTFYGFQKQAADLAEDTVDELRTRLIDEPESFSNDELLKMTQVMADRTGNGPTSKSESNVNVKVGLADRMLAAEKRLQKAKVIEGDVIDV